MFGKNEKVGKAYFKDISNDELLVTSRFYTLQGEGPFRGRPAYFIRLAKCNLNCSFCDTYFDSGDPMTFDELLADASKDIVGYDPEDMNLSHAATLNFPYEAVLVLSGGEPSLQKNIRRFINKASKFFTNTQIESNGVLLANVPDDTVYVVSPKCLEKDGIAIKYLKPNQEVLQRADCLKFVMSAPEDKYSPYSEIPEWAFEWKRITGNEIFVSPMNIYNREPQKSKMLRASGSNLSMDERSKVDEVVSFWELGLLNMEVNQRNHEYTAKYALINGLTFNMQQHLFASMA